MVYTLGVVAMILDTVTAPFIGVFFHEFGLNQKIIFLSPFQIL